MSYPKIAFIMAVLFVPAMLSANSTLTIDYYRADGVTPYFCNPCYYRITNSTANVYDGKTNIGDDSVSLSLKHGTYNIMVTAQVGKMFNFTEQYEWNKAFSGVETLSFNMPVKNMGKLAVIDRSESNSGFGYFHFTSANDITGETANNTLNTRLYENITYSVGFDSWNTLNWDTIYSRSGTMSISALIGYDYVLVAPRWITSGDWIAESAFSSSVKDAIKEASSNGVKVVMDADMFNDLYAISSSSTYPGSSVATQLSGYGVIYQNYTGTQRFGYMTKSGGLTSNSLTKYFLNYGYDTADRGKGVWTSSGFSYQYNESLYMTYSNYYVSPLFLLKSGSSYRQFISHQGYSLIMGSLLGFSYESDTIADVTTETRLASCGVGAYPITNVLVSAGNEVCTTSGGTTSVESVSDERVRVVQFHPDNMKYTTTMNILSSTFRGVNEWFADDVDDSNYYSTDWFGVWKRHKNGDAVYTEASYKIHKGVPIVLYGSPEIMGRDLTENYSSSLIIAHSKDKQFPNKEAYFSGTGKIYMNKLDVSAISVNSSPSIWIDRGFRYYPGTPIPEYHDSCDLYHRWNVTYYAGYNTSHFIRHHFYCDHGNFRDMGKTFTNTTETPFPEGADVPPLAIALIQTGEYEIDRGFLIVTKEMPSSMPLIDTTRWLYIAVNDGGADISYTHTKTTKAECVISMYPGTYEFEYIAPAGYAFLSNGRRTLIINRTISGDSTFALELTRVRPLTLNVILYETTGDGTQKPVNDAICRTSLSSTISDNDGKCSFYNVLPHTEYAINITKPGGKDVSIYAQTGDYEDSTDIDKNGEKCLSFDGNFSYSIDITTGTQKIRGVPLFVCGSEDFYKSNVKVGIHEQSCITDTQNGYCVIVSDVIRVGGEANISLANTKEARYEIIPETFSADYFETTSTPNTLYYEGNLKILEDKVISCSLGYTDCILKSYVTLQNASGINCDTLDIVRPGEGDADSSYNLIAIMMDVPFALLRNKTLLGMFLIIGGALSVLFATKGNVMMGGILTLVVMVIMGVGLSDMVMGTGNGMIGNDILALIVFMASLGMAGIIAIHFNKAQGFSNQG